MMLTILVVVNVTIYDAQSTKFDTSAHAREYEYVYTCMRCMSSLAAFGGKLD